jgi:hypothetical protein
MNNYAVVVIDRDGTTSVGGPFTSEPRARLYADRITDFEAGISADVYEMETPRAIAAWSRGEDPK